MLERLLSIGAALAAILAAIGIYGVMAQSVNARRREFGVRFALGATRRAIAQLVLSEAVVMGSIGAAAGLVATVAVVRLASAALLGIPTLDVRSVLFVVSATSSVVLAAGLSPALRAARVDVAQLLRSE